MGVSTSSSTFVSSTLAGTSSFGTSTSAGVGFSSAGATLSSADDAGIGLFSWEDFEELSVDWSLICMLFV